MASRDGPRVPPRRASRLPHATVRRPLAGAVALLQAEQRDRDDRPYGEAAPGEQRAAAKEMQRGIDPSALLVEVVTRALQEPSVARQFGGDISSAAARSSTA